MTDNPEGRARQDPGGLRRRRLLGAAAAGAAGMTATVLSGCDRAAPRAHRPGPARRSVAAEPGRQIASAGPADAVQGYADRISVRPGEEFGLHVSTTARSFRVSAFRVGWYGGAQAGLVWRSGRTPGRVQSGSEVSRDTRTVRAAGSTA